MTANATYSTLLRRAKYGGRKGRRARMRLLKDKSPTTLWVCALDRVWSAYAVLDPALLGGSLMNYEVATL